MRRFLKRDIPAGAAITVVALALVASVVTGREEVRAPEPVAETGNTSARSVATDELDLQRLNRPKKDEEIQELFASRTWTPVPIAAPVVQKPTPPPAPSAPPLPFKYLGRMADGATQVVFLERNQNALSVKVGDKLENDYRVENIADSAVTLVYLPLGTRQVLNISAQY